MAPLTILLALPIATAIALPLAPDRPARWLAATASATGLLLALFVAACFDATDTSIQWLHEAEWMPAIGAHYRVGVDGLSVLFVPATELLFAAVLLFDRGPAWRERTALLLVLKAATLGIFVALDGLLFFLFWELALVPTWFLVARHGIGARAPEAAMQYTLMLLLAGVPVLLALVLRASVGEALDFDLRHWMASPPDEATQRVVFVLLLAGFTFKVPLAPFHTWLPALAREGGPGLLATIVGLKVGAFAILRLAIPVAPEAAQSLHWLLAGLGAGALVFGALASLAQTNLRGLLAYASVSHVGLVVLALSSFSVDGVRGATMQLLNFSLASAVLFLLAGALQRRLGTNEAGQLGGVAGPMPLLASFFVLFVFAGFGAPGTSGFPAELTMLFAIFDRHAGAALAALLAAGIGAAAALGLVRRVFFGPATNPAVREGLDLDRGEAFAALAFALLVLGIGFFPGPLHDFLGAAARDWAAHLPAR
jgi:NADH-quinone oxidoreductase subunit M